MDITVIGSSSRGNAYLVESGEVRFLLECGLNIAQITAGCSFKVPRTCLISHEHKDHCKCAMDLAKRGVNIVCSDGTAEAIGLKKSQYVNGLENVISLKAIHDCAEPWMYIVDFPETHERLFFATDTNSIQYEIKGITHLMIETNWSWDTVGEDSPQFHRSEKTHMSLETAKAWIKKMDQSKLKEVHLIHLSSSNSDSRFFKEQIQEVCGVPVYVAKRG